jgi:hypothetical protein
MEKATIHFKGQVAELMENKGKLHAKVVCDTDRLLISIDDVNDLELGGEVTIEGEIKIKSIQFEELGSKA